MQFTDDAEIVGGFVSGLGACIFLIEPHNDLNKKFLACFCYLKVCKPALFGACPKPG